MAIALSIIIPNNNELSILHRMINSIPDRPDFQIIVVDNSPVPLTKEAAVGNRTNVEVYYSDSSRRAGGARNEGLPHVRGQWLMFADADDFFTPDAFNIIEKDFNSDYEVTYYGATSCFSDTLEPANRNYVIDQYIASYFKGDETRLRYYWDAPVCKLIKTDLVKRHNILFEEIAAGDDMGFSVRVGTYAKTVRAVNKPVYCITILSTSTTHTRSKRNAEAIFKAVVRLNNFLKQEHLRQYRHSILKLWLESWRKGPFFALKLLFYSWGQGNSLFVGYQRWFNTLKILVKQKPKV